MKFNIVDDGILNRVIGNKESTISARKPLRSQTQGRQRKGKDWCRKYVYVLLVMVLKKSQCSNKRYIVVERL